MVQKGGMGAESGVGETCSLPACDDYTRAFEGSRLGRRNQRTEILMQCRLRQNEHSNIQINTFRQASSIEILQANLDAPHSHVMIIYDVHGS